MSDNIVEPTYTMLTRVRVKYAHDYPDGFTGKIVHDPRWTAIGWETRVLPDGVGQVARWIQADLVSEISAIERLGELGT